MNKIQLDYKEEAQKQTEKHTMKRKFQFHIFFSLKPSCNTLLVDNKGQRSRMSSIVCVKVIRYQKQMQKEEEEAEEE